MASKQSTRKKAPVTPEPPAAVVVDALDITNDPDFPLIASDSVVVNSALQNIKQLFRRGGELERAALATLGDAKALTAPTTGEEDAAIQTFIKGTSIDKKEIETHWAITAVVNNLHKRLVARRQRGVVALEEAAKIGNALHNAYTEAEKKRAAAESERLRKEAEEKAQRERDEELARLEEQAVKLEEQAAMLSAREQAFVSFYYMAAQGDKNAGARAAQLAGFADGPKSAARLLTLPKIQSALKAKRDAAALRTQTAAVAQRPLEVEEVAEVKPNIIRGAGGGHDRTTWTGVVDDEAAFIAAIVNKTHNIPIECLQINQVQLNEYARALHEKMNLWPGVHAHKKTGVV